MIGNSSGESMMTAPHLLLWNFSQVEGSGSNLGDKAIFSQMVQNIQRVYNGKCNLLTLSSDPDYTRSLGVEAYPFSFKGIIKAVRRTDIIVLGGGELIQDRTSRAYLVANLYLAFLALFMNKPFCCYSIGVAEKEELSILGGWITRLLLDRATFITVRDPQSKERLNQIGVVTPDIYITADEVMSGLPSGGKELTTTEEEFKDRFSDPYIIISARKRIRKGFSWVPHLAKNLSEFLITFSQKTHSKVIFVPFYPEGRYSPGDLDFSKAIALRFPKKENYDILDPRDLSYNEMRIIFSNAELVIGMNLHSLIIATSLGTPAIAISYGSKISNFMELIHGEERVFSIQNIEKDSHELVRTAEHTWNERHNLRTQMEPFQEELKMKASKNATILKEYFP
jgi:polysaccharide pyruvyl transferase WcaK-like protein